MGTEPGDPGGRRGDHRHALRLVGLRGMVHARLRQRPRGRRGLHPLLAIPILISLERPVRITPEQAVKDFYGSLSHHVPHFRRMWLLLSTGGRTSGHFSTFPEFKKYWVDRLAKLPRGARGAIHPLEIRGRRLQVRQEPGQDVRRSPSTPSRSGSGAVRAKAPSTPSGSRPAWSRARIGCGIWTRDFSRASGSETRCTSRSMRARRIASAPDRRPITRPTLTIARHRAVLTGIARPPPSPAEGEVGDGEEHQAEGGIDQEECAPDGQPRGPPARPSVSRELA